MTDTYLGIAAMALVAITATVWIRAIQRVEIPQNRSAFIAIMIVAGALGVEALLGSPGWLGGIPAGLSIFVASLFLLTVIIGGQKASDEAIQVGNTIPGFTSTDEHGQTFDSQTLAGQPVFIKFFRGHW